MSKKKKKRMREAKKRAEALAAKQRLPRSMRPDPYGLDKNALPEVFQVIAQGSDEEILKTISPHDYELITAGNEDEIEEEHSIEEILKKAPTPFEKAAIGLDILTKSEEPKDAYLLAKNLFRELRRHDMERLEDSPIPWLAMTRCAARAGEFEDCVAISNEAYKTAPSLFKNNISNCTTEMITDMCLAAINAGRATTCMTIFETGQMQAFFEPYPSQEMYHILLRACAYKQLPEKALTLLDQMQEYSIPRSQETYAQLMMAVAQAPQYHRAYARLTDDILDEMDGDDLIPTTELYTALITACGRCGDARAATVYFDEMSQIHNLPTTSAVYVAYFSALARAQTVGMRGGTKPRYIVRPPYWSLGISTEEAHARATNADPALMANFFKSEDAVPFTAGKTSQKKKGRGLVQADFPIHENPEEHLFERRMKNSEPDDHHQNTRQMFMDELDYAQDEELSADQKKYLVQDEDMDDSEMAEIEQMARLKYGILPNEAQNESTEEIIPTKQFVDTRPAPYKALDIPQQPDIIGPVTRLRELGNNPQLDRTATGLRDRQEAHIQLAERAFKMIHPHDIRADVLNAYFSVYTEAHRLKRARQIAQDLAEKWPNHFPNERSNRHVTIMLARRGQLEAAMRSLDFAKACYGKDDIEAVGAVLDAHARKEDLETSHTLAQRLLIAHNHRANLGIGASNHKPIVPHFLKETQNLLLTVADKRLRGPPERLLRNYRRLCRIRKVTQPENLALDPALWRQRLSRIRRSKAGMKSFVKDRAYLRVFTKKFKFEGEGDD